MEAVDDGEVFRRDDAVEDEVLFVAVLDTGLLRSYNAWLKSGCRRVCLLKQNIMKLIIFQSTVFMYFTSFSYLHL